MFSNLLSLAFLFVLICVCLFELKNRWNQSDAGLWELRTFAHIHTYSSVMCWAACDRLSKVACRLHLPVCIFVAAVAIAVVVVVVVVAPAATATIACIGSIADIADICWYCRCCR